MVNLDQSSLLPDINKILLTIIPNSYEEGCQTMSILLLTIIYLGHSRKKKRPFLVALSSWHSTTYRLFLGLPILGNLVDTL